MAGRMLDAAPQQAGDKLGMAAAQRLDKGGAGSGFLPGIQITRRHTGTTVDDENFFQAARKIPVHFSVVFAKPRSVKLGIISLFRATK